MSVLVKGMEMPKNCGICGFKDGCEFSVPLTERPFDCPLIEVPEDIQPIKHCSNLNAAWYPLFECSICHWKSWDTYCNDTSGYDYCPNCGAKMDGEEDD